MRYWLERAWLPAGELGSGVTVTEVDGVITAVERGVPAPADAVRLAGLTIPGMANCHSHAFHRALRGRTQRGGGTFWTWRQQMYAAAERLTPDTYYDLARATYREMAIGGITTVGEFHYLHHQPDGTPYDDPNAMGAAVVAAARDAGIRIALLDTCYLAAGIGREVEGVQRRFGDGDAAGWQDRVDRLPDSDGVVVGAAIHSIRAVPRDQMGHVAAWAERRGAPLHLHLSEQAAENDDCRAAYATSPTRVFADAGVLGDRTTAVHATHLSEADIALLGATRTHACFCPTTERDLGDGIGPSRQLYAAGSPLTLGSDSHAVIDLFEEMRAVELDERLATGRRGHWSAAELVTAATGHASLGFPGAGAIKVGYDADLVTVDLSSPRTAGTGSSIEGVVFAAGVADVVHVVARGKVVARPGDAEEVGAELDRAIGRLWGEG